MKCPKCDLVTFDHLAQCPRCKASFARQRRLTRRGRRSDRPIVIPRPDSGASDSDAASAAPGTGPSPPEPRQAAAEGGSRESAGPQDSTPPSGAARRAGRAPNAESRGSDREPRPSAAPPTAEQQAADAAALKERMKRAGQARRAHSQNASAEIDPALPDWYEPLLDDEQSEEAVAGGESPKR